METKFIKYSKILGVIPDREEANIENIKDLLNYSVNSNWKEFIIPRHIKFLVPLIEHDFNVDLAAAKLSLRPIELLRICLRIESQLELHLQYIMNHNIDIRFYEYGITNVPKPIFTNKQVINSETTSVPVPVPITISNNELDKIVNDILNVNTVEHVDSTEVISEQVREISEHINNVVTINPKLNNTEKNEELISTLNELKQVKNIEEVFGKNLSIYIQDLLSGKSVEQICQERNRNYQYISNSIIGSPKFRCKSEKGIKRILLENKNKLIYA